MPRGIRSSDVYLKEDIRSILQAILATNEMLAIQMPAGEAQSYRSGFAAAVAAAATAFGINLGQRSAYRGYLMDE